jgi:galactokinase
MRRHAENGFQEPRKPHIDRLPDVFADLGLALCLIETGSRHDSLGTHYDAIAAEMRDVAHSFHAARLADVPSEAFYARLPSLRGTVSDRAILRAVHYFEENDRVAAMWDALQCREAGRFLRLVRASGQSSWMYLQNVYIHDDICHQPVAAALTWCHKILGSQGPAAFTAADLPAPFKLLYPKTLPNSLRVKWSG